MDDVITVLLKDKSEERRASPWKGSDDWEQERVDISLTSKVELLPQNTLDEVQGN